MSTRVQGWDISLNHGAMVELTDGDLTAISYVIDVKKAATNGVQTRSVDTWIDGVYYKPPKTADKQSKQMDRLSFWARHLGEHLDTTKPDYVGIEDYAFNARGQNFHIGEVGGVARLLAFISGCRLRLHDPLSVKLATTGRGDADKEQMAQTIKEVYGANFDDLHPKVAEDVYDAFAVAQLLWTEIQVREGALALSDLQDRERRVFNRVTKTYPVNLLARDFIQDPNRRGQ